MKTKIVFFSCICFLVFNLHAQVEITVNHLTPDAMSTELSTALSAASVSDPLTVTKLTVTGSAFLTLSDCQAIRNAFREGTTLESPGTLTLDFSGASFQNDSIPKAGSNTNGAFNELYSLKEVILPANIRIIGAYAFRYCRRLGSINLNEGLKVIDTQAFANNATNSNTVLALTSLPSTVEKIGDYAFASCNALALTTLPVSLKGTIGQYAFQNTSIAISQIPEGVTMISNGSFNCGSSGLYNKITSVSFPFTLGSLAANAFSNQTNITAVEFKTSTPPVTATPSFPVGITITVPYNEGVNKAAYEATGFFSSFTVIEGDAPEGSVETFPVTLRVIDKTKGAKTNHAGFNETNVSANISSPFIPSTDWNVFDFSAGVNIGVWLSQTSNRGSTPAAAYFKESDVEQLKQLGFDHIRLPVDEKELFNADNPRTFKTATVQLIHNAIGWCQARNMRIILDFHILRSHYFNDTENMTLWTNPADQDLFVQMWEKMSDEFGHYPKGLLAYELLNETVPPTAGDWNALSARVIAALRAKEPNRILLIGGMSHNSASALASLTVPANDPNLILVYHFYSPHLLTHYKASWMDGLKNLDVPIHYPGQLVTAEDAPKYTGRDRDVINYYNGYYDKAALKNKMQTAINKGIATGLKLYVSEVGCIKNTPSAVRTAWMKDVAEIFTENNIAFSIWGWKADFGILNNDGTVRDPSTIQAATKGKSRKYNLFPSAGNPVEKNDTAWIWSVTIQAKSGDHTWIPWLESTNGSINSTTYQYDLNGDGSLQFNVGVDGTITGDTILTIPELFATVSNPKSTSSNIQVRPTIFNDHITVNGAENFVEIYNSIGQKIVERQAQPEMNIKMSSLGKGFYMLIVDKKYAYKLMK